MKKNYDSYIRTLNKSLEKTDLISLEDIDKAQHQNPKIKNKSWRIKMKWIIPSAVFLAATVAYFSFFYADSYLSSGENEHNDRASYFNVKGIKPIELSSEELAKFSIYISNDSILFNTYSVIYPEQFLNKVNHGAASVVNGTPDSVIRKSAERAMLRRKELLKEFAKIGYNTNADSFTIYSNYSLSLKRIEGNLLAESKKPENAFPLVFIYSRHSAGNINNLKHSLMSTFAPTNHPLFYSTDISDELWGISMTLKPHYIHETQYLKKLVPIKIKIGKNEDRDPKEAKSRMKKNNFNYAEYYLWFEPTPEFINKLPERYRNELRKELNIIEAFDKGEITKEEACQSINDNHDYFNFCVGVSNSVSELMIYPYPSEQTDINCSFELKKAGKVDILLYSVEGKLEKNLIQKRYLAAGKHVEKLNMTNVKKGMYMLVLIPEDGDEAVIKMIR